MISHADAQSATFAPTVVRFRRATLGHFVSGLAVRTLTLLVGNTFVPLVAQYHRRYPAIESFLSRCDVLTHRHTSTAGWICAAFGVKRRPDWPVGAIVAHAHEKQDTDMYWLCADPVHLAVDRDSLVLQPQSQLQLSKSESLAIFTTLESHFATADLRLVHVDTGHWCFGTPHRPHLVTSDLELVEGRNVNDVLPSGQDGSVWQRYITEAQMILHDHPVNAARESRGDRVANSLWLWGGGVVPDANKCFDRMSVDDPLLREIGKLSGAHMSKSPDASIEFCETGNNFAEFPARRISDDDDVLERLESNWMAPVWHALRTGKLDKVTLVLRLSGAMIECSCERKVRRRFWKRRHPLAGTLAKLQEAV